MSRPLNGTLRSRDHYDSLYRVRPTKRTRSDRRYLGSFTPALKPHANSYEHSVGRSARGHRSLPLGATKYT